MLHRCIPALRHMGFLPRLLVLLALALLPAAAPAGAQESEVFTVRDVVVDVTAGSSAGARDQAIGQAQSQAFDMLVRRLTPRSDGRQAAALAGGGVETLVDSFEVQEERSSAVRYIGTFTVRFRPAAVRQLLLSNGVRYAEVRSKPVLVLPVEHAGGQPVLWERETAWRQAWAENASPDGLLPVLVPAGDVEDVAAVGAAEAVAGQADALARIAQRYGAGEVLVAEVGEGVSGVKLTRHRPGGRPDTDQAPLQGAGPEPYAAAVTAVVERMEEEWKRRNLVETGAESLLTAAVPIQGMQDWAETRKRLSQVPTVTRTRVVSLNRSEAVVELAYLGDVERLRTALAQRDLGLSPLPAGRPVPATGAVPQWQLAWSGAGRTAAQPAVQPAPQPAGTP